ncbi:CgeB family protein [Acinetobacter ursingii]|uniref:CgeB family protein n=1 Tax=Acinetobacter ursingii TaxID=108980 RepID=UPI00300BBE3A
MNILYILDDFTLQSLKLEDNVNLIPASLSYHFLWGRKIDLLLVESAWIGNNQQWRHKIARYTDHSDRNNEKLKKLIDWAKKKKIPTIFWNKEDPFHFDQFIDSAKIFDFVFTTDSNVINDYKLHLNHNNIYTLPFSFQPKIHYPSEFNHIKHKSSLFIGSYNKKMHENRRKWQNLCFESSSPYGLTIVNRNANIKDEQLKFPIYPNTVYTPNIPYLKTRDFYSNYQQSINVNTITDSPTMFSRRLLEIMACQRLVISNSTLAIDHLFPNLCEIIEKEDEADELFLQLSYGLSSKQEEKVRYACNQVFQKYTVKHWLKDILIKSNIDHPYLYS